MPRVAFKCEWELFYNMPCFLAVVSSGQALDLG